MTNGEVDAIEVEDTPVGLQWGLTPGFKLLRQAVIETADRTGAGGNSHQRLGHLSDFLSTDSCHKHLRDPLGSLWFIATVAFKHLCLERSFAVSGNVKVFDGT